MSKPLNVSRPTAHNPRPPGHSSLPALRPPAFFRGAPKTPQDCNGTLVHSLDNHSAYIMRKRGVPWWKVYVDVAHTLGHLADDASGKERLGTLRQAIRDTMADCRPETGKPPTADYRLAAAMLHVIGILVVVDRSRNAYTADEIWKVCNEQHQVQSYEVLAALADTLDMI